MKKLFLFFIFLNFSNTSFAQIFSTSVSIENGAIVKNTAVATNGGTALAGVIAVSKTDGIQAKNVSVHINSGSVKTIAESNSKTISCAGVICILPKTK